MLLNYIILAVAAALFGIFIAFILSRKGKKKEDPKIRPEDEQRYMDFMKAFCQSMSIKAALVAIKDSMTDVPMLIAAVDQALSHLEASILRDYRTAFGFIEAVCTSENIKQFHEDLIKKEIS